jgi:hypothetical protein
MPLKKEEVTEAILSELKTRFKFLATATDDEIQSMLGHKDIRPAYKEIKDKVNGNNAVPDGFRDSGIDASMWEFAQSMRESRSAARAAHAESSKLLAEKYDREVKRLAAELDDRLAATTTPIVQIIELGVNDLPAQLVFTLNKITDKAERAKKTAESLTALRKRAVERTYADVPFQPQNEQGRELQ